MVIPGYSIDYMCETIDETLLFQISKVGMRMQIEIDEQGNVGLAVWKNNDKPYFLDASVETLKEVISKQ